MLPPFDGSGASTFGSAAAAREGVTITSSVLAAFFSSPFFSGSAGFASAFAGGGAIDSALRAIAASFLMSTMPELVSSTSSVSAGRTVGTDMLGGTLLVRVSAARPSRSASWSWVSDMAWLLSVGG